MGRRRNWRRKLAGEDGAVAVQKVIRFGVF